MERETETLIRELQQQKPAACQWLFTTYGPAGSASIRVRSLNRDPISFDGSLDITY